MKHRRDCTCPCHRGGVAIHVVACCDGMLLGVSKIGATKKEHKSVQKKPSRPSPAT
jgi:hypothetical protein